ncbi:hypothetical protein Avbf_02819 [Armadillidium vulgare]|nr:hypothetical protein Avbf_02819 [Armadillidium vulgare]
MRFFYINFRNITIVDLYAYGYVLRTLSKWIILTLSKGTSLLLILEERNIFSGVQKAPMSATGTCFLNVQKNTSQTVTHI